MGFNIRKEPYSKPTIENVRRQATELKFIMAWV